MPPFYGRGKRPFNQDALGVIRGPFPLGRGFVYPIGYMARNFVPSSLFVSLHPRARGDDNRAATSALRQNGRLSGRLHSSLKGRFPLFALGKRASEGRISLSDDGKSNGTFLQLGRVKRATTREGPREVRPRGREEKISPPWPEVTGLNEAAPQTWGEPGWNRGHGRSRSRFFFI